MKKENDTKTKKNMVKTEKAQRIIQNIIMVSTFDCRHIEILLII